jgi:DNA-binding protein HU-beta
MHKIDFIKFYAKEKNITMHEAKREVDTFFEIFTKAIVLNEEVNITGFGKFYKLHAQAKDGINPKTRAKIVIPAYISIKFTSGKELKNAVRDNK